MKSAQNLIVLLLALMLAAGAPAVPAADAPSGPHIIMIIRHGEKPDDSESGKDPDLSKKGFERADALAKVIPARFPTPDFLFATHKSKNSNRPVETITPLSAALREPIDATFKVDEVDKISKEILTDPKYAGKTILIAWHHEEIPELAKALGVKNVPDKWDAAVFDRVWVVTYNNGVATWRDLPQKALAGDSEK
jgi:broad specificity phosphatase PhoE